MKELGNRVLLITGLLLIGWPASSQAIIQRTDGVKVEAKVLEIKGTQIFYQKSAHPEGPTYVISTEIVQQINYQNGTRQKFAHPLPGSTRSVVEVNHDRNVVSVRPLDLIFPNLSLTYERLSRAGKLGFKDSLWDRASKGFSGLLHLAFIKAGGLFVGSFQRPLLSGCLSVFPSG